MRISAVKAILTTMLIVAFVALAFSGALLHFGKTGVILGISRHALRNAHFVAAVLMCALAITHLVLNRRLYGAELRSLGKKNRD